MYYRPDDMYLTLNEQQSSRSHFHWIEWHYL